MKRSLFLLGATLSLTQGFMAHTAHAFGGEDPIAPEGPMAGQTHDPKKEWHHEAITEKAALAQGFSTDAADALAWTTDYLDSYLYSPIWWAQGVPKSGINRVKLSMALAPELEAVHFDDLFSADKVNYAWRRYTAGTFAGLLWASEQKGRDGKMGDVAAGQNVVGASLHAIEDFFSHSNWVDDPARRNMTFFEMTHAQRRSSALYTGAYEKDQINGVKHHGKYLFSAAITQRPGVKQVLEAACSAASPISSEPMCLDFKAAKDGISVSPTTTLPLIGKDVTVPKDVLVLAPPGIALDNTWLAAVGVQQRGIDKGPEGVDGPEAYDIASKLAVRQASQWLETLGKAMGAVGKGDFWNRITQEKIKQDDREYAFENFSQFPFTFMSHGPYPPEDTTMSDEWYLRVRLKTANEADAGTDADIKLRVANHPETLLDWTPRANPILAHNDFEAGDNEVYVVGPFSSFPSKIELYNESATGADVLKSLGSSFVSSVTGVAQGIRDFFRKISGFNADFIAAEKKVWSPSELAGINGVAQFSVPLNGGDEGNYAVDGTITKVSQDDNNYTFSVRLDTLRCIKRSKVDGPIGHDGDEPFVISALNPLPGGQQKWRCEPFSKVQSGQSRALGQTYENVTIPKEFGYLNLALSASESDLESERARNQARDDFAGRIEASVADEKKSFGTTLGTYLAPAWKLGEIEVTAFTRNGEGNFRYGQVLNTSVNKWVNPRRAISFDLNFNGTRDTGISYANLMPQYPAQPRWQKQPKTETAPAPVPTPSPIGTTPDVPTPDVPTPNVPDVSVPDVPVPSIPGPIVKVPGIPTIPRPNVPVPTTQVPTTPVQTLPTSPYGEPMPIGKFEVSLESVKIDRTGSKVEALFNFRNATSNKEILSSSGYDLAVIDADGVGSPVSGEMIQAAADAPFPSTPNVAKGSTLKARFIIPLKPGTPALKKLTLQYWRKDRMEFDISGLAWPKAAVLAIPTDLKGAENEFQALGEAWDVRFDGWRKGRDGAIEVFATYKNLTQEDGRLTYQSAEISVEDTNGLVKEHEGELYRIGGTTAPLPTPGVVIVPPDAEAKVRYRVRLDKGLVPAKIVFTEGRYKKDSFEIAVTP